MTEREQRIYFAGVALQALMTRDRSNWVFDQEGYAYAAGEAWKLADAMIKAGPSDESESRYAADSREARCSCDASGKRTTWMPCPIHEPEEE